MLWPHLVFDNGNYSLLNHLHIHIRAPTAIATPIAQFLILYYFLSFTCSITLNIFPKGRWSTPFSLKNPSSSCFTCQSGLHESLQLTCSHVGPGPRHFQMLPVTNCSPLLFFCPTQCLQSSVTPAAFAIVGY